MKYKLEPDEELSPYEGWAFLHFHTMQPSYVFADRLNRLYDLQLARQEDLEMGDAGWPFYFHDDPVGHAKYFLTERPAAATNAPWEAGDKLLAIRSENAADLADDIYHDLTSNVHVDPNDLLAVAHADCLAELLGDFTVATQLDFQTQGLKRRTQKEVGAMLQHCDRMLAIIEQRHLDLSAEARMRLSYETAKNNFAH